ncbi:hypothetical protein B0H21DRAFT_153480 [Amylocystis lapponica]|nr:hypothetical protein B0H21DRAFT_153480 [Amylocystis lapponica]
MASLGRRMTGQQPLLLCGITVRKLGTHPMSVLILPDLRAGSHDTPFSSHRTANCPRRQYPTSEHPDADADAASPPSAPWARAPRRLVGMHAFISGIHTYYDAALSAFLASAVTYLRRLVYVYLVEASALRRWEIYTPPPPDSWQIQASRHADLRAEWPPSITATVPSVVLDRTALCSGGEPDRHRLRCTMRTMSQCVCVCAIYNGIT